MNTQISPHIDDIGVEFILTIKDQDSIVVNLSTATTMEVHLKRADATAQTLLANFVSDGTDGKMKALSNDQTFSVAGNYRGQAHIIFSDGDDLRSSLFNFIVLSNIF